MAKKSPSLLKKKRLKEKKLRVKEVKVFLRYITLLNLCVF